MAIVLIIGKIYYESWEIGNNFIFISLKKKIRILDRFQHLKFIIKF